MPRLQISAQPASLSLTEGESGELSVTASGYGTLSYQWFKNGSAITNATASSIRFDNISGNDAGSYYVVVYDDNSSTMSSAANITVTHGKIIKAVDENGNKRYDFQFINKRGHKTTIEGLSDKFNPEFWNYAKLISGVLRYGMPIDQVLKLVGGLELDSQSINTWKMGVERALKKYLPNGTTAKGQVCPNCGQETLVYQEGCLICTNCGTSKCG